MDDWIIGYDTNGVLVFLAITLGPAIVAVARWYRFPNAEFLDRWFEHHDLEPTAEAVDLVTRALRRTKTIRTIGFVVAYSVPQLVWMIHTRDGSRSEELPFVELLIAGWTSAVLAAALWPQGPMSADASLSERRVDDYRPAFSRFDRELLVAVMLGLVLAALVFPGSQNGTTIDGAAAVQRVAPALVVMAVVLVAQRIIVGRRQSQPSLELVRVDDALRAVSVSALTGIGYGVPLLVIAALFWQLSVVHEPSGLLMLAVILLSMATNALGLMSLLGFGRLGNEVVVYRHRLRRVSEVRPSSDRSGQVPR